MSELRDERDDLRKLADQHEWEIADLRTKLEAAEKERDAALAKVAELRRLLHEHGGTRLIGDKWVCVECYREIGHNDDCRIGAALEEGRMTSTSLRLDGR